MKRQNVFTALWKKTGDSMKALFSGAFVFLAIQLAFERNQAFASTGTTATCDRVAQIAPTDTNVLPNVLLRLSTESNRPFPVSGG